MKITKKILMLAEMLVMAISLYGWIAFDNIFAQVYVCTYGIISIIVFYIKVYDNGES